MKTPQTSTSTSTSTHPAATELARLELRERAVSRQRRDLHRRIDRLYLGAPLDDEQTALLDQLERLEQEISGERRRLHRRIDELRDQSGLPPRRERNEEAETAG